MASRQGTPVAARTEAASTRGAVPQHSSSTSALLRLRCGWVFLLTLRVSGMEGMKSIAVHGYIDYIYLEPI